MTETEHVHAANYDEAKHFYEEKIEELQTWFNTELKSKGIVYYNDVVNKWYEISGMYKGIDEIVDILLKAFNKELD